MSGKLSSMATLVSYHYLSPGAHKPLGLENEEAVLQFLHPINLVFLYLSSLFS